MTSTIDKLTWTPRAAIGGEQAIVKFPNGYSASVLRGGHSYSAGGTYEIAVLGPDGDITYDVLGYQTEAEANAVLAAIAALPAAASPS